MPRPKAVTFNSDAIVIEGLADFNKALKSLDAEFPKELKQSNYDLAKALVDLARARATSGIAKKASRSLRAGRQANAAVVTGGGPRAPYFWGAEFGAKQYRQFKAWRGNQWEQWDGGPGYFLHPTIRDHATELIDEYMKRLDELTAKAFPE